MTWHAHANAGSDRYEVERYVVKISRVEKFQDIDASGVRKTNLKLGFP